MWRELATAYGAAESKTRNAEVLRGFLYEANQRDKSFAPLALEAVIGNPDLAPILPYLQASIGIAEEGIARLRRAIANGVLVAANFHCLANGSVVESPPEPLAALLEYIATLSDGVEIALDILHMHFFRDRAEARERNARLVSVGRELLARAGYSKNSPLRDFGADTVIRICLAGKDGIAAAEKVCADIRSALDSYHVSSNELSYSLNALFEPQPFVALDSFLLQTPTHHMGYLFDSDFGMESPIKNVDPVILQKWASGDPGTRYPLLGKFLSTLGKEETEFSPLFLAILDQAPDKRLFLGGFWDQLHPSSWSGSLADIFIQRKEQVMKLAEHADEPVRAWVTEVAPRTRPLDQASARAGERT